MRIISALGDGIRAEEMFWAGWCWGSEVGDSCGAPKPPCVEDAHGIDR
jgi:hypothetical protein